MWKPKQDIADRYEAPPGVAPWRDLSDEEYAELDKRFGPLGAYFDHVADTKKKAAKAAGGDE